MDRFLTWGGNTWVLLILLMLAARDFDTYHWPTHFNGGSAAILVNGICLLLFAVPLVSLQVRVLNASSNPLHRTISCLDTSSHLYERVRPTVRPSLSP